jgi:hypothetical protein
MRAPGCVPPDDYPPSGLSGRRSWVVRYVHLHVGISDRAKAAHRSDISSLARGGCLNVSWRIWGMDGCSVRETGTGRKAGWHRKRVHGSVSARSEASRRLTAEKDVRCCTMMLESDIQFCSSIGKASTA